MRLLLDKGADFNGRTTLEAAAEYGILSILNIVLNEGALGVGADEIESAKALAKGEGHRGCVERLELALYRLRNDNGALLPLLL